MKYSERLIAEEIKDILIQMTINNKLPMDMTQLDMVDIFNRALKQKHVINQKRIENAGMYLSYDDDEEMLKAVNDLFEANENGNEDDFANTYADVWDGVENISVHNLCELLDSY